MKELRIALSFVNFFKVVIIFSTPFLTMPTSAHVLVLRAVSAASLRSATAPVVRTSSASWTRCCAAFARWAVWRPSSGTESLNRVHWCAAWYRAGFAQYFLPLLRAHLVFSIWRVKPQRHVICSAVSLKCMCAQANNLKERGMRGGIWDCPSSRLWRMCTNGVKRSADAQLWTLCGSSLQ